MRLLFTPLKRGVDHIAEVQQSGTRTPSGENPAAEGAWH